MKRIFIFLFLLIDFFYARADHITGGEMYYTLVSSNGNLYTYNVTVKLFMDCFSPRQFSNPAIIGIFNRHTNARVTEMYAPLTSTQLLDLRDPGPCITDPPPVCYRVGFYNFDVTLAGSVEGYILTAMVNYRINSISNLMAGYGNVGATYTGEIPGTAGLATAPTNSSAHFVGSDLVIVCSNNSMQYSFAASDADGDELRYSFCDAWQTSGNGGNGAPGPPPYQPVPYGGEYTGSTPLGGLVQIDSKTGMIRGPAPGDGIYVVTVCVEEIRRGVVIARQRKDLQIKITGCSIAAATIPPAFMLCRNSMTINLANRSTSPLIRTQHWEIRNRTGGLLFSSTNPNNDFTFADTGTYSVKLVINRGDDCADSSTSLARVYPGFIPAFDIAGICVSKPSRFINRSTTRFGHIISWAWDFGQPGDPNDFSELSDPDYTFSSMGPKFVRMIITNSNGCIDTAFRNVTIVDKPPIALAFRDTLICTPDVLELKASGGGNFSWTPNISIVRANTPNPVVNPGSTTKYYVELEDNGCRNKDSVQVRVVDHVTLQMMKDTLICQGDTIRLRVQSDGLRYAWTPAAQIVDPTVANPLVVTRNNTRYSVTARIGSCMATLPIDVNTVPYPIAHAGADATICFNAVTQLQGSTDGKRVTWMPSFTLSNPGILQPIAAPRSTTFYILAAFDDKGCPKPGFDTVKITVLPDIIPFAGNDTTVIVGQPLQLRATGGTSYLWKPGTGLSDVNSHSPIALYNSPSTGISYKVLVYDEGGCVDSAYLNVKVFKTKPSVFVPNAFTPNKDGKNDVFRFIAAGMQKIDFFRVYNRWGQLVFSAQTSNPGWDGTLGGRLQQSGVYVWMVKGIDYLGGTYFEKGTTTLIR